MYQTISSLAVGVDMKLQALEKSLPERRFGILSTELGRRPTFGWSVGGLLDASRASVDRKLASQLVLNWV